MRGVAKEVGGFISATNRRKMFNEFRIVKKFLYSFLVNV